MEPPRKTEGKRAARATAAGALLCVSALNPASAGTAAPSLNSNQYGFNRTLRDFQMLVPENGWNDNTASTTYYFYIEVN